MNRYFLGFFLFGCVSLLGCGPGGPKYEGINVAGKVTLGGAPIEKGAIEFSSKAGVFVSGEIKAGTYQVENVGLGPNRVTIRATRETGKMNTEYSTPFPEIESIIPERYRGGMDAEVTKDSKNLDFALESQ